MHKNREIQKYAKPDVSIKAQKIGVRYVKITAKSL
jgi:hypothetical protein